MLFPTSEFVIFFLLVFAIAWALRGYWKIHKLFLALASLAFYGFWDVRFVPLLIGMGLYNYWLGTLLGSTRGRQGRIWISLAVSANLAVLCAFKYYDFFAETATDILATLGYPLIATPLGLGLPIGISFFTFHCISYVIDVYRGRIPPASSFVDLLLYIAFFPHLVAGPIIRAAYFLPQLIAPVRQERIQTTWALTLIASGYVKKIVVAGVVGTTLVDPVFADPGAFARSDLLLALYGYAVQIYCDFSGYTDMAIGIAALIGFRFPENFDRPYQAVSLREFWRRWHISLSTWLRDYVYTPLGGSRSSQLRTMLNIVLTMLVGGLWHGANLTFVIWGLLLGCCMAIERMIGQAKWHVASLNIVPRIIRQILVFHVLCVGWILFRSPTMQAAEHYFLALYEPFDGPMRQASPYALLLITATLLSQHLPHGFALGVARQIERWPGVIAGTAFALFIYMIGLLGPDGVAPFIYFKF